MTPWPHTSARSIGGRRCRGSSADHGAGCDHCVAATSVASRDIPVDHGWQHRRVLIERGTERDLDDLAALLVDAVESGACVGFLEGLGLREARLFWQSALDGPQTWVARLRADGPAVGLVQLHFAEVAQRWAPSRSGQTAGSAVRPRAGPCEGLHGGG